MKRDASLVAASDASYVQYTKPLDKIYNERKIAESKHDKCQRLRILMAKQSKAQPGTKDRLAALLRGAFAGSPTKLKERRKAKDDSSDANVKTVSRRKKNSA